MDPKTLLLVSLAAGSKWISYKPANESTTMSPSCFDQNASVSDRILPFAAIHVAMAGQYHE